MKSLYSKLKKLIRSKNNLKKCELKAKETEKKKIKGMKRIENEPLLNPKEAEKKQIQRNQERIKEESLFKPKKDKRKQKQTEKRKYRMKLN